VSDDSWHEDGAGGPGGLDTVAAALDAEGVPFGWDPYDPTDAVSFMWPGTQPIAYRIQVPVSEVARARGVLSGRPPAGVRYVWDTSGGFGAAGGPPEPDTASPAPPRALERPFPTPVTAYGGPELSDNDRLERMASGGGSGAAWVVVAAVALILVAVVLFLVFKV
jgi:hypothetical protein